MHEQMLAPLRPSKVIALALNTSDLSERRAQEAIARAKDDTGLPATDPVRYDPSPIVDAIEQFHGRRQRV
jgi:uncharacterized NAD-dependent epimerase/dehydratase family protein